MTPPKLQFLWHKWPIENLPIPVTLALHKLVRPLSGTELCSRDRIPFRTVKLRMRLKPHFRHQNPAYLSWWARTPQLGWPTTDTDLPVVIHNSPAAIAINELVNKPVFLSQWQNCSSLVWCYPWTHKQTSILISMRDLQLSGMMLSMNS